MIALLQGYLDTQADIVVMTAGQPRGFAGTVVSLGTALVNFLTNAGTTMTIPYGYIANVEALQSGVLSGREAADVDDAVG
jgi:hypothetical protein